MSLVSDLEYLFNTKEDSDVIFIIKNQEIKAHKFILIHRSSVFKAMIKGPMAPANQKHKINDPKICANDFNNFLKYFYSDKCEINYKNVEVMLHLSHMYDVPGLFQMCVNKLPQFFSTTSPLKYAELGILYDNAPNILVTCLKAFPPNSELKYQNGFKTVWISPQLAVEFVKRCPRTSALTEDDVFRKIFIWAYGQCKLRNLETNSTNLKAIMAPLVQHLDLEKMDMELLTSTIYKYKLIPQERLLKCFRNYIVKKESKITSSHSASVRMMEIQSLNDTRLRNFSYSFLQPHSR